MSRRPNFRRDDQLKEQIRKLNRNVQNKQSRIRTGFGLEVQGVETVKFKDFNSRREIESYIRQMNKFLKRDSKVEVTNSKGATLDLSLVKKAKKQIDRVNKIKEQAYNELMKEPFLDRGKPTGMTIAERGMFGDRRFVDFTPLTFNVEKFRSNKELKNFVKKKDKTYKGDFIQRKNELYQRNFQKALENVFGRFGSRKLRKIVRNMDNADFIKLYYQENLADIDFIYDFMETQIKKMELEELFTNL